MSSESENVGIAFGVVIGAGLATAVGAAVVFIPSLVRLADGRVLAASLGFSAGVMGYVSFIEIFAKSQGRFVEGGHSANASFNLASLCFFGGTMLMLVLNSLVRKIVKHANHRDEVLSQQKHPDEELAIQVENARDRPEKRACDSSFSSDDDSGFMCTPGCSSDPTNDLEFYKFVATQIVKKHMKYTKEMASTNEENISGQQLQKETQEISEETGSMKETEEIAMADDFAQRKLMHMSLSTAIAIGLHNFPEGLATFVAVLANPSVGAVLGVAIAIHNIPEGLCVALPVYYATGNRRKAFLWGTLSGITEPIAALFGWAVLSNSYSPTLFGVLFGLVAGMMVMISVRELLPTAHRYDPHDKFVTMSFLFGMAIMGLSLVLFKI